MTFISVPPFLNDNNPAETGTPGYFNMGFYSDAPKTLHTFETDVLSMALTPQWVKFNQVECEIVPACQDSYGNLFPC